MAQKFKVFVAVIEDLSSVSSTYWMLAITWNSSSRGIRYPLLVFAEPVCVHTHTQPPTPSHTHTQTILKDEFSFFSFIQPKGLSSSSLKYLP